ncbi:YpbF family protein [Heyndrickxia faecalis]|uniref:YpbF family protein n=1 Tax=Heyndrickxia faecalis TaxID=2824910 RepID=UPI001B3A1324|nr:YpbF family protein [Heyndrickxia faecalis]MBQ4910463.1 YpbF family protein [Heyndrickxia faecalis]
MEPSITGLKGTDAATKQMLQSAVKRKKKFDRLRKRHLVFLWTSMLYTCAWAYYVYRSFENAGSVFSVFSSISESPFHLFFLLVAAALWGMSKILFDKREKAEKEFHALRCEIIDKSKDLWKGESWKDRHLVFEMMQKEFDINLYHENK